MLLCWQIGSSHCREHTWISHDPQSIFKSSSVWISSVTVWWIYIKGEVTPENLSFNEQSRDGMQKDYFALSSFFIGLSSQFILSISLSNILIPVPFPISPVTQFLPASFFFFLFPFIIFFTNSFPLWRWWWEVHVFLHQLLDCYTVTNGCETQSHWIHL